MKLLITGSKGFIGRRLEQLYKENNNLVYGWDVDGVYFDDREVSKANMLNPNDTYEVMNAIKPDLIIHCAGSADVNKSVINPLDDLKGNYITTENILFAIKKCNLENTKFVLLSSAAVYGNPLKLPMSELEPINPLSPYALHKKAAEDVCLFMSNNYGIKCKIARIFSVYGPGLKKQIFWDMHKKIQKTGRLEMFGSGDESRDYIFIDDLIEAIYLVSLDESDNLIFNIANGIEVKIRDVAQKFADAIGLEKKNIYFTGSRREGEPINWKADITKLKNLGYKQKVSFDMGVVMYADWLKSLR